MKNVKISLTQIIQRDSRNRPEFPTQGSVYSIVTELSGGPLQGEEDFIKNILSVEWYVPMKFGFVFPKADIYRTKNPFRWARTLYAY